MVQVHIRAYLECKEEVLYLASSTPVPNVMHICRESRARASSFYEKFSLSKQSEQIYVWVNLDVDIIDIGNESHYTLFKECGPRIRRLKFEASNLAEWWYHGSARDLPVFDGVQQCFVLAIDGWEAWEDAFNEHYFACAAEDLYIIDKNRSRIVSFPELEGCLGDDDWHLSIENLGVPYDKAATVLGIVGTG